MSDNEINCPRCRVQCNEYNRLITESCGHSKCRACFLKDVIDCQDCREIEHSASSDAVKVPSKYNIKRNGARVKKKTDTSINENIQELRSPQGKISYKCTICQKVFYSRSQRCYHLGCDNKSKKRYKCEQCERCFASRSHLNYHRESHLSQIHRCQLCDKTFKNRMVFKKHQKLHQVKPTSCDECGKSFRCKQSLEAHIEHHRNNLRFQCHICEKKYASKSTLRQHMLKHLAKKFECKHCGKKFHRNSTLKLHIKRHSKTDIFVCQTCSRHFSDSGTLLRHAKIHEVTIKYKCIECNITSIRKDNMLRHVRNMHVGASFQNCVEIMTPTSEHQAVNQDFVDTPSEEVDEEITNLPKTVENSSVIKCIGNVEPVKVPNVDIPSSNAQIDESESHLEVSEPAPIAKPHYKKKYDPIEMYRKILISDDEYVAADNNTEQDSSDVLQQHDLDKRLEQQRVTLNTSNFSEMHWRKNFKYTYEFQDY